MRRAYEADPYPTQPSIDRLASELGIGPRTVVNWFHNHRMRYAKQQYAATGIWSVTGSSQKLEPADDLDQSSQNGCDQDSINDAASSTDQGREENLAEFDAPVQQGADNTDEGFVGLADLGNPGPHSASCAGGANRRKSARPQRLGIADGKLGEKDAGNTLTVDYPNTKEFSVDTESDGGTAVSVQGQEQVV